MFDRIAVLASALGLVLGLAAPSAMAQDAEDVSKVSLISESPTVQPGQTVLLGLHFELADAWHIYWDGVNDTGFPPAVDWDLPEGVAVGPMLWPAPKRYESPGNILDHVYEGSPTILIPLSIDESVAPGTALRIAGQVEWLVCNDICLPGFGPVSIDLEVVSREGNAQNRPLDPSTSIGRAASRLPEPLHAIEALPSLRIDWSDTRARVAYEGAASLRFYPSTETVRFVSVLDDASTTGDELSIRFEEAGGRLAGVLEVGTPDGVKWYLMDAGPEGLRPPQDSESIARVRDRVSRTP